MKREYESPEYDIEFFNISSSICTSGFGWEEEDVFGDINEGDENPWA